MTIYHDNEKRLFKIRERLEEYRKHKNDPYVYYLDVERLTLRPK